MLRGACYIRVSTDNQTEFSPSAQLKAIKSYAKNNNIEILDDYIFVDKGISGRKADKRPAFQDMIKIAKSKPKKFDVILVHKFDRFARSREDSVVYKSLLKKECNIKVISITESIEDDKFSVILEAMLEAMAEYYSLNLSDEVKKGMTEKAIRGQYQSSPPFGYSIENGILQIIENEADIIKFVFDKFTTKEMNKMQLAKYINKLGIKTHRGNLFDNRNIEYILTNPVYIGYTRWTPSGKMKRGIKNEDTIIVKSDHIPIIDETTFNKAQELINISKAANRKYFKHSTNLHWLNGLIKCKYCNSTLVRNSKSYYQCRGYVGGKCLKSQLVDINKIDKIILEQIKQDFNSKININTKFNIQQKNDSEINIILDQINKIKLKEKRNKNAYMNGIDSLEEYKENKKELSIQKELLEKQLSKIQNKDLKKIENDFQEQLQNLYDILIDEKIDMNKKYEVSHLIIDKVAIARDEGILELTYKL